MKKIVTKAFVGMTLFAWLLGASCAPRYTMDTPASFAKFEQSKPLKLITPKGVKVKVRVVDNSPQASLNFWIDALAAHMDRQGYILKEKTCFKTAAHLDGCTLMLLVPFGTQDWILSESLFVVDDDIYLVEATGPYNLFENIEGELKEALLTFAP